MTDITYTIEPIKGRAAIQKNFVTLPNRASNYSNRHVTLNERFSIIERGYYLKPVELSQKYEKRHVSFVSMESTSTKERIATGLAKMEKQMDFTHIKPEATISRRVSPNVSSSQAVDLESPKHTTCN
ncbi:hypothetical protein DICVIV_05779 [Dictyocaulus viviparus]|uniref:Uncharacterized protein n=1 Tax=Dictyocaulus viviparus TaxID=29172 RepID=A0A0D8XUC1_DICVI|nr:hypothetical protein DICVIV_05779 [Dictyocaulus viviparus]